MLTTIRFCLCGHGDEWHVGYVPNVIQWDDCHACTHDGCPCKHFRLKRRNAIRRTDRARYEMSDVRKYTDPEDEIRQALQVIVTGAGNMKHPHATQRMRSDAYAATLAAVDRITGILERTHVVIGE